MPSLPQCVTTMRRLERIQRAHFRQLTHFVLAQFRHAPRQIIDIAKRRLRALPNDTLARLSTQPFDIHQAKPQHPGT